MVPAGDALSVDRKIFSETISKILSGHKFIKVVEEEVIDPIEYAKLYNCDHIILASGPLTSKGLEKWILSNISSDDFYFYDAIAPVVEADSLDFSKLYFKDRYKEYSIESDVDADYLNAPLNREEYYAFVRELKQAQKTPARDFEEYRFFEGCLPIDLLAERGEDTLMFSCMKPVGLELADGDRPYAVVQLRKENLIGGAYNLVGFQTRLTYGEQRRVFRMIPGLENANFLHLGSVHRNSFLNAKKLLNIDLSSKKYPNIYFAGQLTGVEGYTESAAMGQYAALQLFRKINGEQMVVFPKETAIGALINYIMTCEPPVPSNINFGLLPNLHLSLKKIGRKKFKKEKRELTVKRAKEVMDKFICEIDGVIL